MLIAKGIYLYEINKIFYFSPNRIVESAKAIGLAEDQVKAMLRLLMNAAYDAEAKLEDPRRGYDD